MFLGGSKENIGKKRIEEPFLCSGFSFAALQESGNFPEVTERLYKSVIGLAKTFAPSLKKDQIDCLNQPLWIL